MSVWVQRDATTAIVGVYANQQPGIADEQIAETSPAVIAFFNPPTDQRSAAMKADNNRAAIIARLKTATAPEIDAYVAANVTNLAQARDMLGTILKLIALNIAQ